MIDWNQWIGLLGIVFIIGPYLLLQIGYLSNDCLLYPILNVVGALLLIISLLFEFNLSAFIVECFWAIISIIGVIRCIRLVNKIEKPDNDSFHGIR